MHQDGSIRCGTRKQLQLALTSTGSSPIKLIVGRIEEPEIMELIASHGALIEALTIQRRSEDMPCLYIDLFVGFNYTSLKKLVLQHPPLTMVEQLMDLAVQSTSSGIDFDLTIDILTKSILTHEFMRRITDLRLHTGTYYSMQHIKGGNTDLIDTDSLNFRTSREPFNLPLPNITSCHLSHSPHLLSVLNLSSVEDFQFNGVSSWNKDPAKNTVITTPPPKQTSRMVLTSSVIDFKPRLTNPPYCMPNLTYLELQSIGLSQPLEQYLDLPKLKSFTLSDVRYNPFDDEREGRLPIICETFFRNTPELEELRINSTRMGKSLVCSLQDCAFLEVLEFNYCFIGGLPDLFLKNISNKSYFSSLRELYLRRSWSPSMGVDYTKFISHIKEERPTIIIAGDDSMHPSEFPGRGHGYPY
jgi:hypothetical protein